MIAFTLYAILIHRGRAIPYLLGLLSILPGLVWNFYYFGSLTGGYARYGSSLHRFTFKQFLDSTLGLLLSPSRGLLIFSPIVLYAIPGLFQLSKPPHRQDEQLVICLGMSSSLLLLSYSFYEIWWGGHCYGPRFMTDILPILGYGLNYSLVSACKRRGEFWGATPRFSLLFSVLVLFSVFTQTVGAFGLATGAAGRTAPTPNFWNEIPIDMNQEKLWNWQDNQIRRHTSSVIHRLLPPPVSSTTYQQQLQGNILDIQGPHGVSLSRKFACIQGSVEQLTAQVKNTGQATWFGYLAALPQGEARIQVTYYLDQQKLSQSRLYIPNQVAPGQTADALGFFACPRKTGTYYLTFDLVSEYIGEIPLPTQEDRLRLIYQLAVVAAP